MQNLNCKTLIMKTITASTKRVKKLLSSFKIGLFKTDGIQSLLLPNAVVSIIEIDNTGSILFYSSFNRQRLAMVDFNFYSNLEFNGKDFERTIHISGSTEIVENGFLLKEDGTELILLKMKISRVDFHSNKKSVFEAIPKKINNWLKQLVPSNNSQNNPQVGFN